ncbi:MAG: hypothetical protein WCA82_13125 [Jiangellales bacterium]
MAGSNDDIERLLREMDALTSQADSVLGGDDPTGKSVAKRRSSEPVAQPSESPGKEGLSPALMRALVVSGVATGVVTALFFVLAVLPGFAAPGLSDILAMLLASMLVAAVYGWRERGR